MSRARVLEAIKRWRAISPVTRTFVGGCIDGERRECRAERRIVRGDVYHLDGEVMRYRFTRLA